MPPQLVVGAAVVRHGTLLAARRTHPPETAGRWELPGGKVEPGEDPGDAVVREVAEELGCAVVVRRWLDAEVEIRPGLVLRAAECRLVDDRSGGPVAAEHDRLTWLGPEELGDVDWLEPDRPFLPALRETLLDGEVLAGGHVGGAVRVGATVRRPVGPWTPAVHALLRHLAAAGLPHVPAVHGTDARGREVLDFLPGRVVDVDADELPDARLAALGAWTARLHAAVASFDHPGPWRFHGVDAPRLVAHNDLAPSNLVWDGDDLAGVLDWDLAGPSSPLLELAHLAWHAVPLVRAAPGDPAHAVRRLRLLAASYGGGRHDGPGAREILDAVPGRVRLAVDGIRAASGRGDAQMAAGMAAAGEPARTEAALAGLEARLPALREALASGA